MPIYEYKCQDCGKIVEVFVRSLDETEIKEIIDKFRDSGVQKVGPCHCSGDEARILFYEEYKDDFIEIGVGKEIKIQ